MTLALSLPPSLAGDMTHISKPSFPSSTTSSSATPSLSPSVSPSVSASPSPSTTPLASPTLTHSALLARIPDHPSQPAWQLAHAHPVPIPAEGQVLIKTSHVALNPFDWQSVAFKFGVGPEARVMGRDGAGVVVQLGEGVDRFKVGDRVWFCANSAASGTGAFQEYSVHSAFEVGHTPANLSDQEAATLGTGLITAGVALFRTLGLDLAELSSALCTSRFSTAPVTAGEQAATRWMLIYGGSGITGVYLIQIARLLGYSVICAGSPVNHGYVRSLGAKVVLDRFASREELIAQIREATHDSVEIAIDNVGSTTAGICYEVLQGSSTWRTRHDLSSPSSTSTGRLVPIAGSPKDLTPSPDSIRAVTALRISFSTTFYSHPLFSEPLLDVYTRLLEEGKIIPARSVNVAGGLGGIEKGLEDLRHGRAPGGYKLVARLEDGKKPEGQAALVDSEVPLEKIAI